MDSLSPIAFNDRFWFLEIFIGLFVLCFLYFLFKYLMKALRKRAFFLSSYWRDKIVDIFSIPFTILLWILGVTLVIEVLSKHYGFSFFDEYLNAFRGTGFVLCLAWIVLRWKREGQKIFLEKDRFLRNIDAGFVHIIGKLIALVVILIAVMITLQIWGLDIAPLIAFGGIGAAAAGFAAKDIIANFFGGVMLHLNRPFVAGDTVLLPQQSLEGTIEEIGWNLTTIRDKEKRPNYLPNAYFSHERVVNLSRMTHRKIEEKIELNYGDYSKIPFLIEAIKESISTHPDIDTHLQLSVVLHSLSQRTPALFILAYTLQTRYEKFLEVRQEILMRIFNEVKKADAEISIPSMAIYNFSSKEG